MATIENKKLGIRLYQEKVATSFIQDRSNY